MNKQYAEFRALRRQRARAIARAWLERHDAENRCKTVDTFMDGWIKDHEARKDGPNVIAFPVRAS
jgi:hypothetical protein